MAKVNWRMRRENMKEVCSVCHTSSFVDNFYIQYDGVVKLYNSKFGKPGVELMKILYKNNLITPLKFDEPVEWTWWEIWHHEGRRARHGASMMGPDYTHWHGLYEVAKHWYTKFIPELRQIVRENLKSDNPQKVKGAKILDAKLKEILARPEHQWFTGNMPKAEFEKRRKAEEEFKKRYGK